MEFIKRFLSHQCIGYQKANGSIMASIMKSAVEFTDGRFGTIWRVFPVNGPGPVDYLTECPQIDIPVDKQPA